LWVVGGFSIVLVVAVGALVAAKMKLAPTKCRLCGAKVPDRGDLCQKCRHEAAEVLRRAATERADEHRAKQDSERRQRELVEKQIVENARHEEEARVRREEDARQREALVSERLAEEASKRAENVASAAEVSGNHFDPHGVLGVSRDASKDDIRVAYEQARSKYAPDQVAHLSNELQDHYKEKAQEVEQAYRTLTAS
jgi:DnaJ-domain-containing protein 1